ncbi:LysE family translocator [Streptomyces phaeochromogenes]
MRAALGSACGLLVHATFAAVGLSALVMSSARALTVVKLLGGIYLIWLGVTTWRSTRRGIDPTVRSRWRSPSAQLGGRHRAHGDRHTSVPTWDESPGGSRADCPGDSNSNGELSLRPLRADLTAVALFHGTSVPPLDPLGREVQSLVNAH